MYLDKYLFDELPFIGKKILDNSSLEKPPENLEEMSAYIEQIKNEIESDSFYGALLGVIFFRFVTSVDVRDRKTTSRIFEDIFGGLFGVKATDESRRENPVVPRNIEVLDELCNNEEWNISVDLSSNKREKADVAIGDYGISLKTLKGKVYNEEGNVIDKDFNAEVNVGSFSYRALFKDILSDEKLAKISERKKGLGSPKQLREQVFDDIVKSGKKEEFCKRLHEFLMYVYEEDIYLILKSHYKIIFYLIPNSSFVQVLIKLYEEKEPVFETVWNRWEGNNLRLKWKTMVDYFDEYKMNYYKIEILLTSALENKDIAEFEDEIKNAIKKAVMNKDNDE